MQVIDSHLQFDSFHAEGEVEGLISRATEAGVSPLVAIGGSDEANRLAVELARPERDVRSTRLPWLLAVGFGLLHGLGFASALVEAGLPEGEILLALLSFNLGLEVGQVIFVLGVLALLGSFRAARIPERLPAWSGQVPVYAMGSLAAMWCIERLEALFR